MKKLISAVLILVLALGATGAQAGTIEIYGDGSKREVIMPDAEGTQFKYYDIYGGAKRRSDLASADMFLEHLIASQHDHFGYFRSAAASWDALLLYRLGNALSRQGKNRTLGQLYDWLSKMNPYKNMNSILVTSGNPRQADEAIRDTFAGIIRRNVDPGMSTDRIQRIAGLEDIKTDGPLFATVNAVARKGEAVLGYGSIFYDFNSHLFYDGSVLDSAARGADTIEKAAEHAGFHYEKTSTNTGMLTEIVNNSDQELVDTRSISTTSEVSLSNSHSYSKQIHASSTVTANVSAKFKVPFTTELGVSGGLSVTAGWAGTTTDGNCVTERRSTTSSVSLQTKLPPMSRAKANHIEDVTTITNKYDYPIAITYKVAHYVIFNDDRSSIMAKWGIDGNPNHESAAQNLRKRMINKAMPGYEIRYGGGYPIDWSQAPIDANDTFVTGLSNYIPISITGGVMSATQRSIRIEKAKIEPINKVADVLVPKGLRSFLLEAGGRLDLSGNLPVRAVDETGVAVYGFDDLLHGDWVFCDAAGAPADAHGLASVVEDGAGRETLVAGAAPAVLHLKYAPEDFPYLHPELFDDTQTIVTVEIAAQRPAFTGSVTVDGQAQAELRTPLDLRRDGPAVTVRLPDGTPVLGASYGLSWRAADADADRVDVRSGIVTCDVPGEYELLARYGGVDSAPVKLVVLGGAPVTGIELPQSALTVNKSESVRLEWPRVLPANARNIGVRFVSLDPAVATVDNLGFVTGVGTGKTIIAAVTEEGGFEARLTVTVETPARGEGPARYKIAMQRGAILRLSNPGGATGVWTVQDSDIASVRSGRLTAKKLGETWLRFSVQRAKGGSYRGKKLADGDVISIPVAVRNRAELATGVSLPVKKAYLAPGETLRLSPTVTPASARDREVFFQSDDKAVATVDDAGVVRAVRAGTCTITATTATGKSRRLAVRVTGDVLAIRLNRQAAKMVVGEAMMLTATPVPAALQLSPHFETSDPSVATVDENGLVQAVGKGRCTVSAHVAMGSRLKAQARIEVR